MSAITVADSTNSNSYVSKNCLNAVAAEHFVLDNTEDCKHLNCMHFDSELLLYNQ